MRDKITKRKVDALKPDPANDVFLWDKETKGFGVRLKPSGSRAFVLSYYAPGLHQKRRRLTIGAYGPITVDGARKTALDLLARIAKGEDPAMEAADQRRAIRDETVSALFAEYLQDSVGVRRESTLSFYKSLGQLYILPSLGHLPVARVSPKDVADLHRSLREKPVTANRVVQLLRGFFYWLERRGVFTGDSPARRIERFPEKARERFLTIEEMGRLGNALQLAATVGLEPAPQHRKPKSGKRLRNAGMFTAAPQVASSTSVAALTLLMLTGWREREALTLRWSDVDFGRGMVTLEDTKSGRSVRPVPAPALALIAEQPKLLGSPYVFPGRVAGKPLREIQRLWYAVRHAAELDGVRLHDLRHSVASIAAAQGFSLPLIGIMLGQADSRSTARYAHFGDDVRKVAADSVGGAISEALSAGKASQSVTPLAPTPIRALRRA
jgi:integrase